MKNRLVTIVVFCLWLSSVQAQTTRPWNGKQAAVVLTYDDALAQHLDNALPVLDSLKLKATFYLSAAFPGCSKRINDWRKAAADGHEMGNHTLFHPCTGGPGREWVHAEQDMRHYTVQRMLNEVRMTNTFLEALDGKKKRTFAFTCGDMTIGAISFIDSLKNDFIAARAVRNEMHQLPLIDLYNVDCYVVNGNSAEDMIGWVEKAVASKSLLVILFHGVNGGNSLNVSLQAHSGLLHYLKQQEKKVWIAPMVDVAEYIRKQQAEDGSK